MKSDNETYTRRHLWRCEVLRHNIDFPNNPAKEETHYILTNTDTLDSVRSEIRKLDYCGIEREILPPIVYLGSISNTNIVDAQEYFKES